MKTLDVIAVVLIVIGALNWGLVGFFGFNLVDYLFGAMTALSRIIYALVGLSGLYYLVERQAMAVRHGEHPSPGPGREAPQL